MKKMLVNDIGYLEYGNRISIVYKVKFYISSGIDVTILCPNSGKTYYESQIRGVKFVEVPFSSDPQGKISIAIEYLKRNILALFSLSKLIRNYDYIYSISSELDLLIIPYIIKVISRKKIKWVVVVDNIVPKPSERPGGPINIIPYLAFLISQKMLKKTDTIFVVTNFLKEYYSNILDSRKIIKTGNGIEVDIFSGPIAHETLKSDALYCGRLHEAKGAVDLIKMSADIVKANHKFFLVILGVGLTDINKRLKSLIEELKLDGNIRSLGFKTGKEKGDLIRSSKYFVFLSYDESYPLSIIEALGCNKMVLAYDLPIYHEVFGSFINSGQMKLFKVGDYMSAASYITNNLDNSYFFHNNIEDWGWEKIADKELSVFDRSY